MSTQRDDSQQRALWDIYRAPWDLWPKKAWALSSKVVGFALVLVDHGHPWMLPAGLETCSCSCPNVCYIHAFPLQIGLHLCTTVLTSLPIGLVIWAPPCCRRRASTWESPLLWNGSRGRVRAVMDVGSSDILGTVPSISLLSHVAVSENFQGRSNKSISLLLNFS